MTYRRLSGVEVGLRGGLTGTSGQSDSQGGCHVVEAAAVHRQTAVLGFWLGERCG